MKTCLIALAIYCTFIVSAVSESSKPSQTFKTHDVEVESLNIGSDEVSVTLSYHNKTNKRIYIITTSPASSTTKLYDDLKNKYTFKNASTMYNAPYIPNSKWISIEPGDYNKEVFIFRKESSQRETGNLFTFSSGQIMEIEDGKSSRVSFTISISKIKQNTE